MNLKRIADNSKASQDKWEMWQMLKSVADINPQVIVEIGVDKGGGLESYNQAFSQAKVIGIESEKRDELKNHNVIYGDSQSNFTVTVLKTKLDVEAEGKIDFLFIDGDHTYEGVKKDFELYSPLVRKGGVIGFHDTRRIGERWKNHVEVAQFFNEVRKDYKSVEFWNGPDGDNGPGTGLLFV